MTVTHSGILTSTEYANAPAMLETSEGVTLQIGPAMRPKDTPTQKLNPTGLCACGCGETTRLADRNRPQYGWVKGQHVLYVSGHHHRKPRSHGNSPVWSESCGCFLVPLTENRYAKVDARDVQTVSGIAWCVDGSGYAWASIDGKGVRMHRLIMSPPANMLVDHRNHQKLDNRRENLRVCTKMQNNVNLKGSEHGSTSQYIGVSWDKSRNKWVSRITAHGVVRQIGRYEDEREAAIARDIAALESHGEYARLNFPDPERDPPTLQELAQKEGLAS